MPDNQSNLSSNINYGSPKKNKKFKKRVAKITYEDQILIMNTSKFISFEKTQYIKFLYIVFFCYH